jgi:hypothetical protein
VTPGIEVLCPAFLNKYQEVAQQSKKVRGTHRLQKITLYENVYKAMVTVGIAEKEEQEVENETRVHSKFQLTKPTFLLSVDETGCNMNQLDIGRVGGVLFVVPKDDNEAGAPIG